MSVEPICLKHPHQVVVRHLRVQVMPLIPLNELADGTMLDPLQLILRVGFDDSTLTWALAHTLLVPALFLTVPGEKLPFVLPVKVLLTSAWAHPL